MSYSGLGDEPMTAPTHIVFGVISTTGVFSLLSWSLHKDLAALAAAIIGALLPDIDSPKSTMGRFLPFISVPIERRWGHRTLTHGLGMVLAIAVLLIPLYAVYRSIYCALLIGYLSHLFADCTTKSGVPLFYPWHAVYVLPGNARYRVKTGSPTERTILIVLVSVLVLVVPLSNVGGLWRALRYVIGTPAMAYNDYRHTTMESLLHFNGHWRHSRQPINGTAVILDGNPSQLLLGWKDRTLTYGEQGDILPDRCHVEHTQHPVAWDSLQVNNLTMEAILNALPTGVFISGFLHSNNPFELPSTPAIHSMHHTWIRQSGLTLTLVHAPHKALLRVSPIAVLDTAQIRHHLTQVRTYEKQLIHLQLQRPPVHYQLLREAQENVRLHQRRTASLENTERTFSGLLCWRIFDTTRWSAGE